MRTLPPILALLALTPAAVAQSGWSTPRLVTELNTSASDTAPDLSPDGRTLHFASSQSGDWEIWSTTRPGRGQPFGPPTREVGLGSSSTESGPCLRADGLEILFESLRSGGQGGFDLMRATRGSVAAPWNPPTFVTELNSSGSEASASMTGDGLELYLLSTGWGAPYAPNNSIFVAKRPDLQSPFGSPALVTELAASQASTDPHRDVYIAADGLRIWFTRYDATLRRLNVFEARRTRRDLQFGAPAMLSEFVNVGTSTGVYSVSVSGDGTEMLLAAGFPTGAGAQELLISDFQGVAVSGIAGGTSAASLVFRDPASAGLGYAFALSGGAGGFALGSRTVPLDLDPILVATLGADLPALSAGFLGVLDPSGMATASVRNPAPIFAGIPLWTAAFTLDPAQPFGIGTISNSFALRLH
jgi:hypothetical protein